MTTPIRHAMPPSDHGRAGRPRQWHARPKQPQTPPERIRPGVRVRVYEADGSAWEGVVAAPISRAKGCREQPRRHQPGTQWPVEVQEIDQGRLRTFLRFARAGEMEVCNG